MVEKHQSYFGYLKASDNDTTASVVMNLWAECRKQKLYWQSAACTNTGSYLAIKAFERMASNTGSVENYVSEAVMEKYFDE